MGLNRNAKNLKSDDRLQREYFRRDEIRNFVNDSIPARPQSNHAWLVTEEMTLFLADTCMHCWDRLYVNRDEVWVHVTTGAERCWRKDKTTARCIPGVLVIEELDP